MDRKTKKQRQRQQHTHDFFLSESTQRCRDEPFFLDDGSMYRLPENRLMDLSSVQTLYRPRRCYICKEKYTEMHDFYHALCPKCAADNYARRHTLVNVAGRTALVTGGRIKIGFEIALKLLRGGARVIVTTRFKLDAARRFAEQPDFMQWRERLTIYGLDLRNIPAIEDFTTHLSEQLDALDIMINNAAQTIRKPDSYYYELAKQEQRRLPVKELALLGHFQDKQWSHKLKEMGLLPAPNSPLVPRDEFNEPVDYQVKNSWSLTLGEVDTMELVETQVVNSMAPFLLNSRLKTLMLKSTFAQRFIVNVSAMEGQFSRENKTFRHPHTNMAKASLNMMTRTAAADYARDGIYMNSVDTGWVTQEHPMPVKNRNRRHGVVPPLDCVDGAARVLAPIFDALDGQTPVYGQFLKDYHPTDW